MFWPRREEDDLDLGEVKRFMQSVNAWMDATPWVEKYYWYGAWWDRVSTPHFRITIPPGGCDQRSVDWG